MSKCYSLAFSTHYVNLFMDILIFLYVAIDSGEQVCKAPTSIAKSNKRFGGNPNTVQPFGRKIGLIVDGHDLRLSTNEWKKHNIASSTVVRQQSKNVRMNKAILSSLKKYDIPFDQQQHVFLLGMDWKSTVTINNIFGSISLFALYIHHLILFIFSYSDRKYWLFVHYFKLPRRIYCQVCWPINDSRDIK